MKLYSTILIALIPLLPMAFAGGERETILMWEHAPLGLPDNDHLLFRDSYISSYDPERRVPQWVCYRISPSQKKDAEELETGYPAFREDPEVPNPVNYREYRKSGYERAYLAPRFIGCLNDRIEDAFPHSVPEKRIQEINYMTNVAPQLPGFSDKHGPWKRLEQFLRDDVLSQAGSSVHVVDGCYFSDDDEPQYYAPIYSPQGDIHVPSGFYRIIVFQLENSFIPLAFDFPHLDISKNVDLTNFLTSIDLIEAKTGLNFFPLLDREKEFDLEGSSTLFVWKNELGSRFPHSSLQDG